MKKRILKVLAAIFLVVTLTGCNWLFFDTEITFYNGTGDTIFAIYIDGEDVLGSYELPAGNYFYLDTTYDSYWGSYAYAYNSSGYQLDYEYISSDSNFIYFN